MKTISDAAVNLFYRVLTCGNVCRKFVFFVCLAATTIVCQAKSEYGLNDPVTVTNPIDKSGSETLKVYSEAQDAVRAESWVISSGRVDCQGYFFETVPEEDDDPDPDEDEEYDDGYDEDDENFDSIVQLALLDNNANSLPKPETEYQLVLDPNFANISDRSDLLRDNYGGQFQHVGRTNQGRFLIGRSDPEPLPVPESATLVLFALGVVGLVCLHKQGRARS